MVISPLPRGVTEIKIGAISRTLVKFHSVSLFFWYLSYFLSEVTSPEPHYKISWFFRTEAPEPSSRGPGLPLLEITYKNCDTKYFVSWKTELSLPRDILQIPFKSVYTDALTKNTSKQGSLSTKIHHKEERQKSNKEQISQK